jgi:hypothetical protein
VQAAGKPVKVNGDASPVAADWDGDGRPDLVVGAEDGSVVWFRNAGTAAQPRLEAPRPLVGKSPVGWNDDSRRGPNDWGLRVKICVVDWDGDGRLDLLLGDRCGSFQGRPSQTEKERAEEGTANDQLPGLRRQWADTFRAYRQASAAGTADAGELRTRLVRLKDEIARVQEVQGRYRPRSQSHGYVWLFLRRSR